MLSTPQEVIKEAGKHGLQVSNVTWKCINNTTAIDFDFPNEKQSKFYLATEFSPSNQLYFYGFVYMKSPDESEIAKIVSMIDDNERYRRAPQQSGERKGSFTWTSDGSTLFIRDWGEALFSVNCVANGFDIDTISFIDSSLKKTWCD